MVKGENAIKQMDGCWQNRPHHIFLGKVFALYVLAIAEMAASDTDNSETFNRVTIISSTTDALDNDFLYLVAMHTTVYRFHIVQTANCPKKSYVRLFIVSQMNGLLLPLLFV